MHPVSNEVCVRDHPLFAFGADAAVGEIGEARWELEQAENNRAATARIGRHVFKAASPVSGACRGTRGYWPAPPRKQCAPLEGEGAVSASDGAA
jgi:hypothetical protein